MLHIFICTSSIRHNIKRKWSSPGYDAIIYYSSLVISEYRESSWIITLCAFTIIVNSSMIHISEPKLYILPRGWNEEAINLSRISRNRLHPGNLLRSKVSPGTPYSIYNGRASSFCGLLTRLTGGFAYFESHSSLFRLVCSKIMALH